MADDTTPTDKRLYLDYASSVPLRKTAAEKIRGLLNENVFYDPGKSYQEALSARQEIEQAREDVALLVNAKPNEVIFTSSGTESVNLAAKGVLLKRALSSSDDLSAQISAVSNVEHQAVKKAALRNGQVLEINVNKYGKIDLEHLESLLNTKEIAARPRLVHCQIANHEVGTIQPYREAVSLAHRYDAFIHLDACAAAGYLEIDFGETDADFLSLSSHKLGGPPGAGALVLKRNKRIESMLVGGSQERGKRAGFENILGIAGFGAACRELAGADAAGKREAYFKKLHTDTLKCLEQIPGIEIHGDLHNKLHNIICFSAPSVNGEAILRELDRHSIAVHSGSACASEAIEPSSILEAMGSSGDRSLRISFETDTTKADIDRFIFRLREALEKYNPGPVNQVL